MSNQSPIDAILTALTTLAVIGVIGTAVYFAVTGNPVTLPLAPQVQERVDN